MPKMAFKVKKASANNIAINVSCYGHFATTVDVLDMLAERFSDLTAENKVNRRIFHLIILLNQTLSNTFSNLFLFGMNDLDYMRKNYELVEKTPVFRIDYLGSIWGSLVNNIRKMNFID